jgi:response regulator of citrate/malate metabolism
MTAAPIRTLVVDDDFRVAAIHAAYVAKVEGFEVVGQAHSAATALDAVAALRPELVLMDVYLPDGDGLGVVRSLIERGDHHPDVIVITAARDVSTVRAAMQLGAVHYLVKPFGFAALQERLTSYRSLRRRMAGLADDADQAEVDELFGLLRGPATARQPEKGHSAPTLELVRNAVKSARGDVSAAEVADTVGISRATAQRYLTYLERHGIVRLQLRYGTTGRPEHRYRAVR